MSALIERVLTSKRKIWLLLIWGLLLTCALIMPDVDRLISQYREFGTYRVKLARRGEIPERARLLAERLAEKQKTTAAAKKPLVPPERISAFTQDITRMARVANCRLRSIRPAAAQRRSFEEVLEGRRPEPGQPARGPQWEVEEQTSAVSLQGSFGNLLKFLAALDEDVRILQFSSLHLHTPPNGSDELILELRIKTFNVLKHRQG